MDMKERLARLTKRLTHAVEEPTVTTTDKSEQTPRLVQSER
jgi:hypothetical protein